MPEVKTDHLPISEEVVLVNQSRHRDIFSCNNLVLKVAREGSDREVFTSWESALTAIQENESSRAKVRLLLEKSGLSGDIVTSTGSFIHALPNGQGITYSEFQKRHSDSVPLAENRLWNLPNHTLRGLRSLLSINREILRREGTCFEIDGSSSLTPPNSIEKILHGLFPLSFSYNLLANQEGALHLVDVENMEQLAGFMRTGVKSWARRQLKSLGFGISLAAINVISKIKES